MCVHICVCVCVCVHACLPKKTARQDLQVYWEGHISMRQELIWDLEAECHNPASSNCMIFLFHV